MVNLIPPFPEELLSETEIPFEEHNGKIGAKIHINTEWNDKLKKLFIKDIHIFEEKLV